MPIACRYKLMHGPQFCVADCPVNAPCDFFEYHRIEHPNQALPPADERFIDIAILDMNHGWPNLGHDSLVHLVQDSSCDVMDVLERCDLHLRAFSFDVRRGSVLPEKPGGRFPIYLGTGGPGHLDPRLNDGSSPGSQGILEDPSWEEPLFALFDAIQKDSTAVLLAVCHTFGVLCRWAGIATPKLRGPEKGGKSTGVLENMLTPEAYRHPWFGTLARKYQGDGRIRIMDNRLFDVILNRPLRDGVLPIGYETNGVGGPRGDSITMVEWARDRTGIMPRIFGVNHHPEIVDRTRQLMILQRKHERGDVTESWFRERLDILTGSYPDENSEQRLSMTSDYTIVGPLRYYIYREIRRRAKVMGAASVPLHEDQLLDAAQAM